MLRMLWGIFLIISLSTVLVTVFTLVCSRAVLSFSSGSISSSILTTVITISTVFTTVLTTVVNTVLTTVLTIPSVITIPTRMILTCSLWLTATVSMFINFFIIELVGLLPLDLVRRFSNGDRCGNTDLIIINIFKIPQPPQQRVTQHSLEQFLRLVQVLKYEHGQLVLEQALQGLLLQLATQQQPRRLRDVGVSVSVRVCANDGNQSTRSP